MNFIITGKLKDMTLPASMRLKNTRGQVTGLAVGPGLVVSRFLFEFARNDVPIWASHEILTSLANRQINVKQAQQQIQSTRDLKVFSNPNWNLFVILQFLKNGNQIQFGF